MSDLLLADEREAVAGASRHLAETGLVIGTGRQHLGPAG